MAGAPQHGGPVGFPAVPPSVRDRWPAGAVELRSFGGAVSDLELRIYGRARAEVAIDVVACCARPALDRELVAALPIGVRLQALLLIASCDDAREIVTAACECGEALELELPLGAIAALGGADDRVEVEGVSVRLPTGLDQRTWLAGAVAVGDLIDGGDHAPDSAAIEAALDAADPLVGFTATTRCPECGRALERAVDLEALCLRRVADRQQSLIGAVHRLAAAYGWTEREVMAVPAWRRAEYLRRVEEEAR